MKIRLSELKQIIKQQINEALTPANKLSLRFHDFYKAYDERDFDKALRDFVDEDNTKMIPWEDERTGERGMMQRGKSRSAITTPEKVLKAHLTYGGRIPKTSRWTSYQPTSASPSRVSAAPRGRSFKTLTTPEPRSGRRQTTNAAIPSVGLSVGVSSKAKHEPGFIRDDDMKRDLAAALNAAEESIGYTSDDVDHDSIAQQAMFELESDSQHWVHALTPQERTKVLRQMTMMAREIFG